MLTVSWELALRADGDADNTVKAYHKAVRSLADWLADRHPEVGPVELERQHVRGWLVDVRESHSSNTARGWFAGVRHFCRWLQSEGEADQDATAGIRTPAPGDPETAVLSDEDLRALLATCTGADFTARRDTAIIMRPGRWIAISVSGGGILMRTRRGCGWGVGAGRRWPRTALTPCSSAAARTRAYRPPSACLPAHLGACSIDTRPTGRPYRRP